MFILASETGATTLRQLPKLDSSQASRQVTQKYFSRNLPVGVSAGVAPTKLPTKTRTERNDLASYVAFFSSLFRSFSANPFANVGWTVRDSAVICFEISQECDYLAIDEPDSFQIENHRSVVTFDAAFLARAGCCFLFVQSQ